MQQESSTQSSRHAVSVALDPVEVRNAQANSLRFPGEDAGRSLVEMAQWDLDAALQLLADRAQYVTGANGAAIALRRDGKNDMLCRASSGENVPELGALLSMEYGLSGESVRTRKALRCDDTERDARVNRDVCRELGIASVVVMPVVHDDDVLGVVELFSGKVNAFGDRDITALKRLSEMVETAVNLARISEGLSERLKEDPPAPSAPSIGESPVAAGPHPPLHVAENSLEKAADPHASANAAAITVPSSVADARTELDLRKPTPPASLAETLTAERKLPISDPAPAAVAPPTIPAVPTPAAKKPLFWSAADALAASQTAELDQSHVPPVLRNLRQCSACGFPISSERMLCVECEEKKWRGHLKNKTQAKPVAVATPPDAPESAPVARLMAQAARVVPTKPIDAPDSMLTPSETHCPPLAEVKAVTPVALPQISSSAPTESPMAAVAEGEGQEFVISAGLEPSGSWLSSNKYVLGAVVLAVVFIVTILWLR